MKKHKKRKIIACIVLILVSAGVITVVMNVRGKKNRTEAAAKQSTVSLSKMDLVKSVSATGTIESKASKSVTAAVNNIEVEKVFVSVGDSVKKGELLVRFDKSALKTALEEAQESLSDTQSDAAREISSARKQLNTAIKTRDEEKSRQASKLAEAKSEKKSAKKAVANAKKKVASAKTAQEKVASREALTKAEEALKQAESAYESAVENQRNTSQQNESSVDNARSALANAQSNGNRSIKEARKQVKEAKENLEDCSVYAPISGVVTAISVEAGDSWSGGELLQIDDTSSYIVSTSVDEYDISNVATGQKVVILTEATGEDELEGEITFVAPSKGTAAASQTQENGAGSSSSTSDGYEVSIAVKSTDTRLKLGMTAKCSIVLDEAKDVFAVPYDAVHEKSDGSYVIYVAGESKGQTTSDSTGDSDNEDRKKPSDMGNGEQKDFGDSSEREVTVSKGMESDYYVEISGTDLQEGMQVIIPTDATKTSSDSDSSSQNAFGMLGGNGADRGNMKKGGMDGAPEGRP